MWFLQPGITFQDALMRILAILIIVFLILPLHECAHGYVAYKLGDRTAKLSGRMTLDPLMHFSPLGSLCLLLFGFGWAKPVPVDSRNFKNPRRDMALTALAGPVSNFIAAVLGAVLLNALFAFSVSSGSVFSSWVYSFLTYYVYVNIEIAVFNLIPLAPLDGSRIMESFIPRKLLAKYYQNYRIITMILFVMLFLGFLSGPLLSLEEALYNFTMKITSFPLLIAGIKGYSPLYLG